MARTLVVVTACDSNPRYLDCVKTWMEFWLSRRIQGWSIEPRLYFVGPVVPNVLEPYLDLVTVVDPDGLPTPFVAQNIRTVAARHQFGDVVMTTDVDMLPLSQKVTKKALDYVDGENDTFVVTRDVISQHSEYPICYSLASPEVWSQIFVGPLGDLEFCRNLWEESKSLKDVYDGAHGGPGWTTDQRTLYKLVNKWSSVESNKLIALQDSETRHCRLDRSWAMWPIQWLVLPLVGLGKFTDYHMRLPASKNRIYNFVLKQVSRIHP